VIASRPDHYLYLKGITGWCCHTRDSSSGNGGGNSSSRSSDKVLVVLAIRTATTATGACVTKRGGSTLLGRMILILAPSQYA